MLGYEFQSFSWTKCCIKFGQIGFDLYRLGKVKKMDRNSFNETVILAPPVSLFLEIQVKIWKLLEIL